MHLAAAGVLASEGQEEVVLQGGRSAAALPWRAPATAWGGGAAWWGGGAAWLAEWTLGSSSWARKPHWAQGLRQAGHIQAAKEQREDPGRSWCAASPAGLLRERLSI